MLCLVIASCTKEKTDYPEQTGPEVPENYEFKEVSSINNNGYKISIQALNGTLYKGYNEVRLKFTSAQGQEQVDVSAVSFLPILTSTSGGTSSCPHQYNLEYSQDAHYFKGYALFTADSGAGGTWDLYISFTIGGQTHSVKQSLTVQPQPNKNLNITSFTGKDGQQYFIGLVSPKKPSVGENKLVSGIYKYNEPTRSALTEFPDPAQFSYSQVAGYTLQLDPRMPEPSMGNHSSPNNKDLTQQDDGLYHGVVNYTMTGEWTLNFILSNPQGKILKGTIVPTDFTPGVEGVKSELHIDILF